MTEQILIALLSRDFWIIITLRDRWIDRGELIAFLAYFLDLNILDFYVWEHPKALISYDMQNIQVSHDRKNDKVKF